MKDKKEGKGERAKMKERGKVKGQKERKIGKENDTIRRKGKGPKANKRGRKKVR